MTYLFCSSGSYLQESSAQNQIRGLERYSVGLGVSGNPPFMVVVDTASCMLGLTDLCFWSFWLFHFKLKNSASHSHYISSAQWPQVPSGWLSGGRH